MLVLTKQDQLVNENGTQSQQLRAAQAFDGHLGMPAKDGLEQVVERFNGLRAEFVENTADLKSVIGRATFAASCGDQQTIITPTRGSNSRIVVMAIAQDKTDLCRQFFQQRRGSAGIIGVSNGQFGSQGNPDRPDGHGQMQFPAVPPAMPADLLQPAWVSILLCGISPFSRCFLCHTPPPVLRAVLSSATARPACAQGWISSTK